MKFDTSEFDAAVQRMQRQLKEVYRPSDMMGAQRQTSQRLENMGLGGNMGKPGMESYFKSIQNSRREMDTLLQKYAKDQQSLLRDVAAHEKALKDNVRLQAAAVKGSEDELRLLREKKLLEENLYRQRESWMARNQTMNQAMDARQNLGPKDKMERLMAAFGAGGAKGGAGEAAGMAGEWWKGLGMTGQAGMIISGLLAAAKGTRMIGNAYAGYGKMPLDIASAQGSATQNTYGREIQSIYGGSQSQEMAFMPEKRKAAIMARSAQESQRSRDQALGISGMVSAGGTGAGGIAGAGIGLINDIFDERSRAYDMSKLPGNIGKRYGEKFESMQAEEQASKYAKAVEDIKAQNPLKSAAVADFAQRQAGDLAFQRATGLNYKGFHGAGGFRASSMNAGFTDQMGMEAAQGILSSGGSTSGAQGLGVLSMQAQRGFGMTNANSVIGKLSGQMGDNENSRQAFIQMLATGTRLGLDSSDYREQNRRFMDAAGSIIERSGVTSQSDIASLLKTFGGFVGNEPSVRGMEGARSAYDLFVQQSSQSGGPGGAMRAASFLGSSIISKFSGQDQAALANIDMNHLSTSNPIIQDLAHRYGESEADIVSEAQKAGTYSMSRNPQVDTLREKMIGLSKSLNALPNNTPNAHKRYSLMKELQNARNEFITKSSVSTEGGDQLANNPIMAGQYAEGMGAGGIGAGDTGGVVRQLEGKNTGVLEDSAVQAAAESARLMLTAFQQFHTIMVPSAEAVDKFNTKILQLVASMQGMTPTERAKFLQANQAAFSSITPKTQPTANQEAK